MKKNLNFYAVACIICAIAYMVSILFPSPITKGFSLIGLLFCTFNFARIMYTGTYLTKKDMEENSEIKIISLVDGDNNLYYVKLKHRTNVLKEEQKLEINKRYVLVGNMWCTPAFTFKGEDY